MRPEDAPFPALPLADQAGCHIEIADKNRLAGSFPQTQRPDFSCASRRPRSVRHNSSNSRMVRFVHDSRGEEPLSCLVDRRHERTTILFAHRKSPRSMFPTPPRKPCSSSLCPMLSFSLFANPWTKIQRIPSRNRISVLNPPDFPRPGRAIPLLDDAASQVGRNQAPLSFECRFA